MISWFKFGIGIVLFCQAASSAFALEVAPRLTDREIIESLAELKQGQRDINARFEDLRTDMNQRMKELRTDMNQRIEELRTDMNQRIDDLRTDMNQRIDDLRTDTNKRFDDVNIRLDTNHRTMLAMFGTLITLIVALFGYIAWDRRTLVKPLQEKLNILEQNQLRETQSLQENTSHLHNLLNALRKLAQEDKKLATVLRSFSLF